MRKLITGVGVAGAMALGGLTVGAAVAPTSVAGGQATTTTTTAPTPTGPGPEATTPRKAGPLAEALAALVEKGALTQAQADAVTKAVRDRVAEERKDRPHRGRRHAARRLLGKPLETAAQVMGVSREQLVAGLRAGTSIAAQAEAAGVDPAKVEQALVSAGTKRIDEAVSKKRLDAERAAALKARLPKLANKLVTRTPKAND